MMEASGAADRSKPPRVTIAHVVASHYMGGLERVVMSLVRGVDRERFRSVLCCIEREGDWVAEIRACCDPVVVLPKKPGVAYALPFRLAGVLKAQRVNLVHCHNFAALVYGSLAGRIARCDGTVYTAHGPTIPSERRRAFFLRLPLVDEFVAVSEHVRRGAVETVGIKAERVTVIRNGVEIGRFETPRDRKVIRSEFGIGDESPVFGSVARLSPEKDHVTLLSALAQVIARRPDAKLLIVGDGPLREELEARAGELKLSGNVYFLGSRPDVPDILAGIDVFVLASREEGLPIAVLEAMAAGLPVVSTSVGGVPDVVSNGKTGLLVPARDPVALASALMRLATDRVAARKMGLEGLREVKEKYDVSRMIDAYQALYQRMLG